jgi:hypothetical protein
MRRAAPAFWYATRAGSRPRLRAEPSWHWAQPGSPPSPPGSPDGLAVVRAGSAAERRTVARATRLGDHPRPGLPKPENAHGFDQPFVPMRPASGPKLIAALVLGPILWLVALLVASWLLDRTDAIELGLLLTAAAFLFSAVVLSLLRLGRRREERRYANRT